MCEVHVVYKDVSPNCQFPLSDPFITSQNHRYISPSCACLFYIDVAVFIYKASMARAAAPMIPAAWVAWAAAPVNSGMEELGVRLTAPVPLTVGKGTGVMEEGISMVEEISMAELIMAEVYSAAEETTELTVSTGEEMTEVTTVSTAELTSGAALLSGMVMGTPAALQVDSTAEMAAAWSSAEQAPSTQGWTEARRVSPFLQWHAKSVRDSQPSLVRGPTKQAS